MSKKKRLLQQRVARAETVTDKPGPECSSAALPAHVPLAEIGTELDRRIGEARASARAARELLFCYRWSWKAIEARALASFRKWLLARPPPAARAGNVRMSDGGRET